MHDAFRKLAAMLLSLVCCAQAWGQVGVPRPILENIIDRDAITLKVATVADLATISTKILKDEMLVEVADCSTAGGGGGTLLRYDAGSSATVDSIWVHDGPGSVGRFLETDRTCVDTRKAGANGTTDGLIVEDACELAMANGVPVIFHPGPYDFTDLAGDDIRITDDFEVIGPGGDLCTITGDDIDDQLFYIEDQIAGKNIKITGIGCDTFRAILTLEDNTAEAAYGRIEIADCRCNNFGRGITFMGGGVAMDAGPISIHDNVLTDMGNETASGNLAGVWVRVRNCPSVQVCNNYIHTVGSLAVALETYGVMVYTDTPTSGRCTTLVQGNDIYNVLSNISAGAEQCGGIFVLGGQCRIIGNHIDTVQAPNHASSPEAIYAKCWGSVIAGNTIIDVLGTEGVINIKHDNDAAHHRSNFTLVSNNTISLSTTATAKCVGVDVTGNDIYVVNNTINGGTRGVILQAGSDRCIIRGNLISNLQKTGTGNSIYGIYGVNADQVIVRDNIIRNCGDGTGTSVIFGIFFETVGDNIASVQVVNNTLDNFDIAGGGDSRAINIAYSGGTVGRLNFSGNTINDTDTGIITTSTATHTDVRLCDNVISNCAGGNGAFHAGWQALGTTNTMLRNTVDGVPWNNFALTAVATTGALIKGGVEYVSFSSGNAAHIIILPAPSVGHKIRGYIGANGFELWATGSSVKINNVICSATNQLAIPATTWLTAECVSSTEWIVRATDEAGVVITPLTPDAR